MSTTAGANKICVSSTNIVGRRVIQSGITLLWVWYLEILHDGTLGNVLFLASPISISRRVFG